MLKFISKQYVAIYRYPFHYHVIFVNIFFYTIIVIFTNLIVSLPHQSDKHTLKKIKKILNMKPNK